MPPLFKCDVRIVHVKWGSEKVGVQLYMHSHFTDIGVSHSQLAERAGLDS